MTTALLILAVFIGLPCCLVLAAVLCAPSLDVGLDCDTDTKETTE